MLVEGGAADANLRRAAMMIRQAGEQGCQIVVLPECLDVGWGHPSALDLAQSVPGEHTEVLAEAARDARIHVVAGITERAEDRIFNAAVLLSPQGGILSRHRKINELTIVQHLYSTGDCLSVARTPLGTLAVNICADNFPSSLALAHCQARMGAQLLLSPCAWAVEAEHDNSRDPYGEMWRQAYSTLASLYDMTVVGVSNVGWITAGPWRRRKCIGCSLAVGPGGRLLASGPYGESAESLIVVPVETVPRALTGTGIAEDLRSKGYEGP